MLPYWLMFVLWAAGAVQADRRASPAFQQIFFISATIITTAIIGLRYEVGGDWAAYQRMYDDVFFLSLPAALTTTDAGYAALNWLAIQFGLSIVFVNTACAILFMTGVSRLAWSQPNPSLAILVAIPYLIIVVAMGYTRQAAAIGLICYAITNASEQKLLRLVLVVGIAALFHKTAILILPLALVPIFRRNFILGGFGAIVFLILSILFLRDSSDKLIDAYVDGNYDSQGATIRVAMTVIPASIFLYLRERIEMPPFQKSFWTTCSVFSLLLVPALAVSSASAGVDRMSLYLIPLQFVLYSRLPYILGNDKIGLPSVLIGLIAYCASVQYVWLNYADNASYWLPYAWLNS